VKAFGAAAVILLAVTAAAAPPAPPWLEEAIRVGSTKQELDHYAAPGLAVTFTTPFLRVARAANKIAREGRVPRAADIEARAWAPELRVLAGVRPVMEGGRLLGLAAPKSARLTLGAGEIQATRMDVGTEKQKVSVAGEAPREVTAGVLKAVFEVRGTPPNQAQLEIRYAWTRDGRAQEIVEKVPLDLRTRTRW
jgi:hypothetical protein